MEFDMKLRPGSVRKLRQHFENNCVSDNKRKDDKSEHFKINSQQKVKTRFKSTENKLNNSFDCTLKESLSHNKNVSSNLKSTKDSTNQHFTNKTEDRLQIQTKSAEAKSKNNSFTQTSSETPTNDKDMSSIVKSTKQLFESNTNPANTEFIGSLPPPKPPRTFAHDLYLELKFNKSKTNSNTNSDQINALYSKPNKMNKLNNRFLPKSDSEVLGNNNSEPNPNEHIYDDCINGTNCEKPSKARLQFFKHLSCLKLK